ncbi:MAG: succinate dehydrogenase cytochrome b subunit [Gemmataceae bacterium]
MTLMLRPVRSSLGKKYVVAITGLLLMLFVLGHMAGNLLLFAGPEAINAYAEKLKSTGALLWVIRAALLTIFVVHIGITIRLTMENRIARPTKYVYERTMEASWASRHMFLTGLVILAFVVYHLAHFTLGVVKPADVQSVQGKLEPLNPPKNYHDLTELKRSGEIHFIARPDLKLSDLKETPPTAGSKRAVLDNGTVVRQDVYSMVVSGFRNPIISLSYLLAMAFLGLHLWHGGSSFLQTLGLNSGAYKSVIARVGPTIATIVVAGNCAIVLAVWLGVVK